MASSEKTEMLTVYDDDLNPIGERSRKEVHEKGLLHQTVRLYIVQGSDLWLQKRSDSKKLFPGRFDLASTGHMDPGEAPMESMLREVREEIGLDLKEDQVEQSCAIRFQFEHPDGQVDNEYANVFVHETDKTPSFTISDECSCMAKINVRAYDNLVYKGIPVVVATYMPDGKDGMVRTGSVTATLDDFCVLNRLEWSKVMGTLARRSLDRKHAARAVEPAPRDEHELPEVDAGDGESQFQAGE